MEDRKAPPGSRTRDCRRGGEDTQGFYRSIGPAYQEIRDRHAEQCSLAEDLDIAVDDHAYRTEAVVFRVRNAIGSADTTRMAHKQRSRTPSRLRS